MPEQVQITDGIQHLVLDELVLETQTVRIDDAVFVHHDGIVQAPTQRQPL
jgi:hypothetical protein